MNPVRVGHFYRRSPQRIRNARADLTSPAANARFAAERPPAGQEARVSSLIPIGCPPQGCVDSPRYHALKTIHTRLPEGHVVLAERDIEEHPPGNKKASNEKISLKA